MKIASPASEKYLCGGMRRGGSEERCRDWGIADVEARYERVRLWSRGTYVVQEDAC